MQDLYRLANAALLLLGGATFELGAASANPKAEFVPYAVDWKSPARPVVDLSFLLEAPAGRDGFIRVQDGRLVRPNGERFRIWGMNATMQGALPDPAHAPWIAQRLAAHGVNCVRFHFLDRPAPAGLIAANRADTRALDPEQLGRLDRFVSELKSRGIYSDLNLNVGRTYKDGDGVRDAEWLGVAKAATYFDARLRELQKEYARQLLTHVNPYTRTAYAQEPAVALVEFLNENSLVESWFNGNLRGQSKTKPNNVWSDIPPSYSEDLTRQYNDWLKEKLSSEDLARWRDETRTEPDGLIPRLVPAQFKSASAERFQTEARFYMEIESGFFDGMSRFLRDELGVRALLAGNSDHNHYRSGYALLASTRRLDVVDSHVYWQHPRYLADAQGRRNGFEIPNSAMVADPLHSTVVQLSRSAVAGQPFTVSEVNHPFPNEFACEGVPILAAYGALQDWDGIFWYTLAHKDPAAAESKVLGHFDFAQDPVKMAQLSAGALLFLRGDVRAAGELRERSYTAEQVAESIRLPSSEAPYFTPGFPLWMPLVHQVRIRTFAATAPWAYPKQPGAGQSIQSDTSELEWFTPGPSAGQVTIATPRSEGIIGYPPRAAGAKPLSHLSLRVTSAFCAVTLSALDDQPIARSGRLLLTTGARVANSSMAWTTNRKSLLEWGAAPTQIERVTGEIRLHGLENARSIAVQPLDGAGQPLGTRDEAIQNGEGWPIQVGDPAAPWYLLTVQR